MNKNAVIVGAGDAVGKRIADDLERMGWAVTPVFLTGQTPTGSRTPTGAGMTFDPTSQDNAKEVAAAIAEKTADIDMLVINIDGTDASDETTILDKQDYKAIINAYEWNAVGPMRALYAFRPLLDKGEGKRVCIVTTKEGSNSNCYDCGGFARHVTKAALNMAANLEFNGLRPQGYTMRMYCKDLRAKPGTEGAYAAEYFTRNRSNEIESYKHSDENRLTLRDCHARELPW